MQWLSLFYLTKKENESWVHILIQKVVRRKIFLKEKAMEVPEDIVRVFDFEVQKELMPVVLVDNGFFTAGAIAYSASERDCFLRDDGRPKKYYLAKVEDLLKVSEDLEGYMKRA